ncbi:MAG: transposase [Ignavibacteria bacterium]|nr:MAG: transposase [Ignavibacteria bacterium]KAF0159127.1 MAG: transposase [Ignavibacteria bacterium]
MEKTLQHRKRNRLQYFDYSTTGYYFVTICPMQMKKWFGKIYNAEVKLNDFGKIVENCWLQLPKHYSNCELDYHVIMPDHFHGIISIKESDIICSDESETHHCVNTKEKSHGLSEIVRAFKSFSSRRTNELITNENKFRWQYSFYDRIVRNEKELFEIRKYIQENPEKWEFENTPENLVI